jgi:rod shape-determining protein MreC
VARDRSRLLVSLLLAAGLALVVLDARGVAAPVADPLRNAGTAAFTPLSAAVSLAATPIGAAWRVMAAAPGAAERIEELEAQNAELRRERDSVEYDAGRAEQLAEVLQLSELGGYDTVPAQAVTRLSPGGGPDAVVLDVGTSDGVEADMTVVNGDGLVGRVTHAGAARSTVLLVSDPASAVGIRTEEDGEAGVLRGRAATLADSRTLHLELLDDQATVDEGQRLLTMGSHDGAPFVPGVPVGTVEEVVDTPGTPGGGAQVRPTVNLSTVDVVAVVTGGPEHDPGDALLAEDEGREEDEA